MDRIVKYLSPPETRSATAVGSTGIQGITNGTLSINATCLEDQLFGSINAAEYFIDSTGSGGSGTALSNSSGIFGYSFSVNVTGTKDTSTLNEGGHTLYVHCRNSDNKWGKFDNASFTVDRTPPGSPAISIESGNAYTGKTKPTLSLAVAGLPADYFALSCNNAAYTEWLQWASTYSGFNITNSTVGCPVTDGSRTVYVKVRDVAGNEQPSKGSGSIILDRVKPLILSISPANNSFLNSARSINIQFSDDNSGIKNSTYSNGTYTASFSNNTPFNPGWSDEGAKTLAVRIFDNAENLNESAFAFKVDNKPPITTDNSSGIVGWKNSDQAVGLTCADDGTSVIPSGCDKTLYCVDSSGTCTPSTSGTSVSAACASGSVCQQYARYYSNDTANNTESVRTSGRIDIDKSKPSVSINSPSNNQYARQTITVNSTVLDTGSGVDRVFFNISNSTWSSFNPMTYSGGFYTGTLDSTMLKDGNYNTTIFANDTANNVNSTQYVNISIDNTPPSTTDNSTTSWYSVNQMIGLTCADSVSGCNTTVYCLGSSCEPSTSGSVISITCASGSVCIQTFRYRSNDTVNNVESIRSNSTRIDKQIPNITLENPLNYTYSGTLQVLTTISDPGSGSGMDKAWYDIRNASNLSQVMKSAFLTAANSWDDSWDSSSISTGTFIFNVSANDTAGNLNYNKNVTFSIDNAKPTITIIFPKYAYKNSSFNVDIRAQTVSATNNISNATWYIYNSSGIQKQNTTYGSGNLNLKSLNFTDFIDISALSDRNYTLNSTSNDTANNPANDTAWFAIDRAAPITTDNSIPGSAWNSSDQTILLSCSDGTLPDGTPGSGCHKILYCINTTAADCAPNATGTSVSVACSSGQTCANFVKYKSNDTAGNTEGTKSSNAVRIDKQAPSTADNTTGLWYANNQAVSLACSDSGSGCNTTVYCVDTSGTCSPTTQYSLPVPMTCASGNVCVNYTVYRSNDTVGNLEPARISSQIRIDRKAPSTAVTAPSNGSIVKGTVSVNSTVSDTGSGVNQVFYMVSNSTFSGSLAQMPPVVSTSYGGTLNTATLSDGMYNISIYANDTVNNVNSSQYVAIAIDNTPPVPSNYSFDVQMDPAFGDYRIYTQSPIVLYVNATDASNVSKMIASINGVNSTMSLSSGSLSNGIWSMNYTNTTSLGQYVVNSLYVNDTLGNSMAIGQGTIGKNFTVVNSTASVLLGAAISVDASDASAFSLNLSFNKTVSYPSVLLFVPPNTPSNYSQAPNYVNSSTYACSFAGGCVLNFLTDTLGKITLVNATGTGSGTTLNITASQTAQTPSQDTSDVWITRFNSFDHPNSTKIRVPFLNISLVACNGSMPCSVGQNANFTLNSAISNVNQSSYSGRAFNVTAKYANADTGLNGTFAMGDMPANASSNATWTVNITRAGNLTFNFGAFDRTLGYNATTSPVSINVTDTQFPSIFSASIDNGIVYINDTISLLAAASDNVNVSRVIAQVNDSSSSVINYTLSLLSGTAASGTWNLTYNNTTSTGSYSITKIYINDTTNNMLSYLPNISFEVRNLSIASALSGASLQFGTTLTIYANVSGNATDISGVVAYISKPRNYNESVSLSYNQTFPGSIYQFSGAYANTSRSGGYAMSVNATASRNASDTKAFSVAFGNATLSALDTINITVTAGRRNMTVFILPANGDLVNITGWLNISNQSVANITSGESFVKVFGNITMEGNSTGFPAFWEINETNEGAANFTIVANSSFNGVSSNRTIRVNVVPADTQPPVIDSVSQTSARFNLLEANTIKANVSDNTAIANVTVEMAYPTGWRQNITAAQTGPREYTLPFSNISVTGNYSHRVIVFDAAGNSNSSAQTNFTAYGNYTVIIAPDHSKYNKGENISVDVGVLNVNNISVGGFNLTLVLDRGGSNTTLVNNQIASQGSYIVTIDDSPVSGTAPATYTIYSTTGKNGNSGSGQASVTVSRVLTTTFVSPPDGTFFSTGDAIPIDIRITNERGETVSDAKVSVQCSQCSNQFAVLTYDPNRSYYNPGAFTAPSTSNKKFSLFAYAVDFSKNDQGIVPGVLLTTEKSSGVSTSPSGGSGGGAAGAVAELPPNQSVAVKSFEFALSQTNINIVKGDNTTLLGSLSNRGNVRLDIESSITKECCEMSAQRSFSLAAGESRSLSVAIHVPLDTADGEYLSKVTMSSSGMAKEQSFKVIVKENALIAELRNINSSIPRIYADLSELEKSGVDTGMLEALVGRLATDMQSAYRSVKEDDVRLLQSSVVSASRLSTQLSNDIIGLQLMKFVLLNKWNIAGIAVSSLVAFYMATQIWMPYYRLRKEMYSLAREEKSLVAARVEAEKQYFLRKINEATFFTIMSQKQGEILKVRSELKGRNEEVASFIVKKLHPFEFFFWLKSAGAYAHRLPAGLRVLERGMKTGLPKGRHLKIGFPGKVMASLKFLASQVPLPVFPRPRMFKVLGYNAKWHVSKLRLGFYRARWRASEYFYGRRERINIMLKEIKFRIKRVLGW